jgi:hypothetical protein
MVVTLSNEQVGTPTVPHMWSNDLQKQVPIDYKENFLSRIKGATVTRGEAGREAMKKCKEALKYCCDNIGNVSHYHLNYMNYLEKCWADHLGVVISPDIIWYTLLCEVAIMVKAQPGNFRSLFTTSDKIENIMVPSGDMVVMPLDTLSAALKERVPTDTASFFPEFSTRTPRSFHAFQAAFCDICSPYYNYMMYCCDIPMVDVRGTLDDWKNLSDKWEGLAKIIGVSDWTAKVSDVLCALVMHFNDKAFWKKIFLLERCGSGHQTEVSGWFSDFFRTQPRVRYAENFSPHVSLVKYKQLNTNKEYEMSVGLFGSALEDGFMVPDFSFVVNENLRGQN